MFSPILTLVLIIPQTIGYIYELFAIICAKIIYLTIVLYLILWLFKTFKRKVFIDAKGKAVLITGCDSGFGNRLAQRLNQLGFRVYATVAQSHSSGALQLSKCCRYVDQMVVMKMDVTNSEDINDVYIKVCDDLNSNGMALWAVVNNAGTALTAPVEWGQFDEYIKLFNVNTFGVIEMTRTFLPLIRSSNGRIVNISSEGAMTAFNTTGPYSMSKTTVLSFSLTLNRELKAFGVKVCAILPGGFTTPIQFLFVNSVKRIWSETDGAIKACYGVNYFENVKQLLNPLTGRLFFSDNIDIVVDDMIDAVCNLEPLAVYQPIGGLPKISWYIWYSLPDTVLDCILAFIFQ